MNKLLAPLAIVGLLVSGCSTTEPAPEETGVSVANDVVQEPTQAPEPQPGFTKPAEFGETVTFPSGIEVTLKAIPLKPNAYVDGVMTGDEDDLIAAFEMTVKNGSEQRLEGDVYSGVMGMPALSHPGQEENGLNDAPSYGTLLPGDKETSTFSYLVVGPAKVRLEVPAPNDTAPAVFEGELTK